jgi:hypothetical protein
VDLNKLYSDHQSLLILAERAETSVVRRVCEFSASQVAGRIGRAQRALGAAAAQSWEALATADGRPLTIRRRYRQGRPA